MYRKAGLLSCEQNKENSKIVQNYLNCSGANSRVSYMKNPPKCVGGNLRIISYQYFSQSIVSAPAQYIYQFYTAVYFLPGLLQW